MPATDPKKSAEAIKKAMVHARKGLWYLQSELGEEGGDAGKEIKKILTVLEKLEISFEAAVKSLPEGGKETKTYADAVKGDFDGIRKAMMDIVTEVGDKTPSGKEIGKILNDFQKVEANFAKAAKAI